MKYAWLLLFALIGSSMAAAAGAQDFTGMKEIRLIHGNPANPKSRIVAIADKVKIDELVATIKLEKKKPCACDHIDSAVFVMADGQITVSLCDHCFDVGKETYAMPPAFYKLFRASMEKGQAADVYVTPKGAGAHPVWFQPIGSGRNARQEPNQ